MAPVAFFAITRQRTALKRPHQQESREADRQHRPRMLLHSTRLHEELQLDCVEGGQWHLQDSTNAMRQLASVCPCERSNPLGDESWSRAA